MDKICTVAPMETESKSDGTICVGSLNIAPAHAMVPTVVSNEITITSSG